MTAEYVCADCGNEGNTPNGPCPKCGSFRVVLISFVKTIFGDDYRKCFDPPAQKDPIEKTMGKE